MGPFPGLTSEAGSLEGWSNIYHWAEEQADLQLAKETGSPQARGLLSLSRREGSVHAWPFSGRDVIQMCHRSRCLLC